jgi:hypothetical protein
MTNVTENKKFNKAILDAKQKFLNDKINYGLEYTIKEETLNGLEVFWITNSMSARKIILNKEIDFVLDRDLYLSDARIILEMAKELNKEL